MRPYDSLAKPHRAETESSTTVSLIERGTREFRTINLAFFAAGFVTFMTLYDVQPLLPLFSREFGIAAAVSSLAVSVTTGTLAISMLIVGSLSETFGRKPIMVLALILTSTLALASALTRSFPGFLVVRLLQGFVLAGLPAVAMAYLGEEVTPESLSAAMGLYIAGNAVGGMAGRIFTVAMTELLPWREVMAIIGSVCVLLSMYFVVKLPRSRNFHPRPLDLRALTRSLLRELGSRELLGLYAIGFLAMGAFVTTYNYITFRLLAPPYDLSPAVVAWIFAAYLAGSYASALAGRLADRFGRTRVAFGSLGLLLAGTLLTLVSPLAGIVAGVVLITSGFFATHSIASSWVTASARGSRGQASALYLLLYYVGSSLCGTAGGLFYGRFGWPGVAGFIALLVTLAFGVLWLLSRMARLAGAADAESGGHRDRT